jgi:hypothetical protein
MRIRDMEVDMTQATDLAAANAEYANARSGIREVDIQARALQLSLETLSLNKLIGQRLAHLGKLTAAIADELTQIEDLLGGR